MASKRIDIAKSIADNIKSTNYFGGSVWIQNAVQVRTQYPCAIISFSSETVDTVTVHQYPRDQERTLTLTVSVFEKGNPDREDTLERIDNACRIVEQAVQVPDFVEDLMLEAIDYSLNEDEPEIAIINMTYSVKYFELENLS